MIDGTKFGFCALAGALFATYGHVSGQWLAWFTAGALFTVGYYFFRRCCASLGE